jgi:DNA-binding MarR family transcriptional regulator
MPPGTTLDDEQLLTQVEHAIRVMGKALYGARHRREGSSGGVRIDRAGYSVLVCLDDASETRLSDLACRLELDISTVSRQVKALEEHGLVQRRPDAEDKRASLLALSSDGRRELARLRAVRVEILTTAIAGWDPADRHRLLELLVALAQDLR